MIKKSDQSSQVSPNDHGMAMMLVLGSIVILVTFSLIIATTLLYDARPVTHHKESAKSLTVARAGLTSTITKIRTATTEVNGQLQGDVAKLPCGTHNGSTSVTGESRDYTVTVRYYTVHPTEQDQEWRNANALPCATGTNFADAARYALIESTGQVSQATTQSSKQVEAVYTMTKFEPRYLGGQMRITNLKQEVGVTTTPVTPNTCWEAQSDTPGSRVALAICDTSATRLQRWHYREDLHIALADTVAIDGSGGLCLDGTWDTPTTVDLTLQPCADVRTQKWFYNGTWTFEGLREHTDVLAHKCVSFNPPSRGGTYETIVGDVLEARQHATVGGQWMCANTPRTKPDREVGAGNAGWATNQLVNFGEYGSCMDIAATKIAVETVISYPCQALPGSKTPENQAFFWDGAVGATKRITSIEEGVSYCLKGGAEEGDKAYFVSCNSVGTYGAWTIHSKDAAPELAYSIQNDHNGLCLGLEPKAYSSTWSVLVSQTCTGVDEQRWNATQLTSTATVNNYREVSS